MSRIEVTNVTKEFVTSNSEIVEALADATFTVDTNEFLSIVGPSGCGKSTLLRLMAGLVAPSSGEVRVSGQLVSRPRTETGFVFQQPNLMPWRNIIDNVTFPLQLMSRLNQGGIATARELLKMVGLSGFEHRMPHELSGGMQQRAGICRALVHDPMILLMDEPFGALDALTREEMCLELLRIWTERPKTIVFVTHSISEAVLLSDRVLVMTPRPGRVAEEVKVLLPRPRGLEFESLPPFQECVQKIRRLILQRETCVVADTVSPCALDLQPN